MHSGNTIVSTQFGDQFEMVIGYQSPSDPRLPAHTFNDKVFAMQFVAQLNISEYQWPAILGSWLHQGPLHQTMPYRVAALVVSGVVRFFKLPSLRSATPIPAEPGKALVFLPAIGNTHQSMAAERLAVNSTSEAEHLISGLSSRQITQALVDAGELSPLQDQPDQGQTRQSLIDKLSDGSIAVWKIAHQPQAPSKKAETDVVPATDMPGNRKVPLGPESSTSTTAKNPQPLTLADRRGKDPESLDDAAQRLESMGAVIEQNGYEAKYSDDELKEQAQSGNVANERYHVRFMEKDYRWKRGDTAKDPNNLTGALGAPMQGETGNGAKYWSTTFDQIEDADTDARLIAEKLGLDYEPGKEYVLVVVDTQKAKPITNLKSVSATFKNVAEFSNKELPKDFPKEFTDIVMNEDFQTKYAKHYEAAVDEGFLDSKWSKDVNDFSDYLETTDLPDTEKRALKKRMMMHDKIGNNQHYEGNGLTKNNIKNSPTQYGAVETLNFERKQTDLQNLENNDAIKILELG